MASCKECIHYDVCKFTDDEICKGTKVKDTLTNCKDFKDKSRYIELPCNAGDTIYHIFTGKVDYFEVYDIQIHDDGIYVTYDFDRYFNADEFGKTVFFTRKEAEEALKERNNE